MGPSFTRMPPCVVRRGHGLDDRARQARGHLLDAAEESEHLGRREGHLEALLEAVGGREILGEEVMVGEAPLRSRRGRQSDGDRAAGPRANWAKGPLGRQRADALCTARGDDGSNRLHDARISGAAAEIAGEAEADARLVRFRQAQHEVTGRHQHARRAEAALERVLAIEGGAQLGGDGIVVQPLDGDDIRALAGAGEGEAGARRLAIHEDGAGAADTVLAAQMRAGEVQRVSNEISEVGAPLRLGRHGAAVERQRNHAGRAHGEVSGLGEAVMRRSACR